jgi:hypothetical protein
MLRLPPALLTFVRLVEVKAGLVNIENPTAPSEAKL